MKWTMEDFKTKKIAVRVGHNNVREFLQMCDDVGLEWILGGKATGFIPVALHDDTVIVTEPLYSEVYLVNTYANIANAKGFTVVDFEDYAENRSPKYRVVIESDGKDTKAVMEVNGSKVKEVVGKLHPKDKFSWRTGAELAFGRLWEPKFGKGKDTENNKEKEALSDFHFGDRVVYVGGTIEYKNMIGKHGRFVCMSNGYAVVEFDEKIVGWNDGERGSCWMCRPENLRHEGKHKPNVREVKRKAQIGEYILIKEAYIPYGYQNGDIIKVISFDQSGFVYGENTASISMKEYVVLEGYTPEKGSDA